MRLKNKGERSSGIVTGCMSVGAIQLRMAMVPKVRQRWRHIGANVVGRLFGNVGDLHGKIAADMDDLTLDSRSFLSFIAALHIVARRVWEATDSCD